MITEPRAIDESEALVVAAPQRLQRTWTLLPNTYGEAMEMATVIANSEFAPKDYKGKPASVMIAIQMGADVGLRPMQALQNIAVINGRPSIWGDGALALTMSLFEKFEETTRGTWPENDFTAVCTLRRRGWPSDTVREFSVGDAKHAGLWGKTGPWTNYPKRMLQMRVRSWALRDAAADRLMGLILAEEAMDIPDEPMLVGGGSAVPVEEALDRVPEALRDNLEKAFELIHLTPGLRRAKVNEYLKAEGVTPEEGTEKLLEWCRDEFAKQKTGQPRAKKGAGNGKTVSQPAHAAPARDADVGEAGVESRGADVPAVPAGADAARGAEPPAGKPPVEKTVAPPELF
jgi:hypothetical protein